MRRQVPARLRAGTAGPRAIGLNGFADRLAPDEARALARALLAGALVAGNRIDDRDLDFDDELAG